MVRHRVHFLGEFGHFNFTVLGKLERHLHRTDDRFDIVTYPDYHVILQRLFPDRFALVSYDVDAVTRDARRKSNTLTGSEETLLKQGSVNLGQFLDCDGRNTITPITRKIQEDEAQVPTSQMTISLCCRNRRHDQSRNLTRAQWEAVVALCRVMSGSSAQIIFHGLPEETYDMTDVPGSYTCRTIRQSIYALNRSAYLVTSMCGFGQFASNCGCNVIQIGDLKHDREYNPFGRSNLTLELKDVRALLGPASAVPSLIETTRQPVT